MAEQKQIPQDNVGLAQAVLDLGQEPEIPVDDPAPIQNEVPPVHVLPATVSP
jgi:hypothetical protein